jgi:predicted thioesterase
MQTTIQTTNKRTTQSKTQTETQTKIEAALRAQASAQLSTPSLTVEHFSTKADTSAVSFPKSALSRIEKIRISEYMLVPSAARRAVSNTPRSTGICSTTELVTTLDQLCLDALFVYLQPFNAVAMGTDVKVTHNRPSTPGSILFIRGHVAQLSEGAIEFAMSVVTLDGDPVANVTLRFIFVAANAANATNTVGTNRTPAVDQVIGARQAGAQSLWAFPPPPAPFSHAACATGQAHVGQTQSGQAIEGQVNA